MDIKKLKYKEKLNNRMVEQLSRDLKFLPKEEKLKSIKKLGSDMTNNLVKYHKGMISIIEIQTMLEFLSQMVYVVECLDYFDAKEYIDICESVLNSFKKKLYRK